METQASSWFQSVKTPKGWVYTLIPAARVPSLSLWNLLFLVVPLILAGAGCFWLYASSSMRSQAGGEPKILIPVSLAFLAAGMALAIALLRQHAGRDELRLDAEAIRAIWRLGPVSWPKTVRPSKVAQLTVIRRSWQPDAGINPWEVRYWGGLFGFSHSRYPVAPKGQVARRDYYALVAEDAHGQRRTLVGNYRREMLLALAVELSSRWKALTTDPYQIEVGPGKLAVDEDTEIPTDIRERSCPPRGTRLIFERVGKRGTRFTMPPEGVFSIRIVALSLLGTGAILWAILLGTLQIIDQNGRDLTIDRLFTWMGMGVLVLIGVLSLATAVRLATFAYVLTATPDSLTLEMRTMSGTSRKTWKKQEIASIRVHTEIVPSSDSGGPQVITRLLIRATDIQSPFIVASADDGAIIQLLRKPIESPASAFAVVGVRTGPGAIAHTAPIAAGHYDYAVRQKTPTGGLGTTSPIMTMIVEPEEELVPGTRLVKPEMEWIATTLREVLGVPATGGSADEVTRSRSDDALSS